MSIAKCRAIFGSRGNKWVVCRGRLDKVDIPIPVNNNPHRMGFPSKVGLGQQVEQVEEQAGWLAWVLQMGVMGVQGLI